MAKVVRPIHAQVGDIVRIIWHGEKDTLTEHHTAPPADVWETRVKQVKAVEEMKRKENPLDRIET